MSDDSIELVQLRNNFYRDNYRRALSALLSCLLIIMLLIGAIIYMMTHPAKPRYFATTSDGRIVPLVALDRPNQSDSTVLTWANEAIISAYSYNFVDYRSSLQGISDYFTGTGWSDFLQALQASNNLDAVIKKKLIMHAVANGPPVVVQKGVVNGLYTWNVQMPVLVSLESASEVIPQSLMVYLMITRVSTLDNPKGISIAQFVATPLVGQQTG